MCLSKNIRYLRRKNKMSQDALADYLGYKSFTTIQKWETGVAEPSILVLRKLSDLFGVDINALASTDFELNEFCKTREDTLLCPAGYSELDDIDKAKVDGFIDALLLDEKYKKDMKEKAM